MEEITTATEAIEHYSEIYRNEAETFGSISPIDLVRAKLKRCQKLLTFCDHLSEHSYTKRNLRRAIFLWREAIFNHNGPFYSKNRDEYFHLETGETVDNPDYVKERLSEDEIEDISYLFN